MSDGWISAETLFKTLDLITKLSISYDGFFLLGAGFWKYDLISITFFAADKVLAESLQ